MSNYIKQIAAALPYAVPGQERGYITVEMALDKLSILVGPNASGKTAILETIGYTVASHLDASHSVLGITLTTTLRPRTRTPQSFAGKLVLGNGETVASTFVEVVHPLVLEAEQRTEKMLRDVLGERHRELLNEMKSDIVGRVVAELFKLPLKYIGPSARLEGAHCLLSLARHIVGQDVDIAATRLHTPTNALLIGEETLKEVSRILWFHPRLIHVKLMYTLDRSDRVSKSIVIESPRGFVVVKKRIEQSYLPELAVFHPGFIYWRGVFERIYSAYIHRGIANEDEAMKLLSKYIEWVKGFELVGTVLHLKMVDGKRISVYKLSDGHRIAVFMALLYALARPPMIFLIDTPEAFVHPDGLPVVADFIARLVHEGNQVVVATQSMEFLRELLKKARDYGVLDVASVQRIALTESGVVRAIARWSGASSLNSIEYLGADLRK